MLPGVQQHPDLLRWRPGKYSRKHRAASHASVVLFLSRIRYCADAGEPEILVRGTRGRLPVEIRTRSARLNPQVHLCFANE
jgi:hypothetical protein